MKIKVECFLKFAGDNPDRWELLTGREIQHPTFGIGRVSEVITNGTNISIWIDFITSTGAKERCFGKQMLFAVGDIEFPDSLGQKIAGPVRPVVKQVRHPIPQPIPQSDSTTDCASGKKKDPKFRPNQLVVRKYDPGRRGRVVRARIYYSEEWNYEIFFSSDETVIIREADLQEWQPTVAPGSIQDLLRDLAVIKLRRPLGDTLYAFNASRTKFEVYQFKPALKFLANPDQRLLIADEVGLGKTIEAGIIYLELQARLELDRVLIVCPSSLRHKWQDEMKARFDEDFTILDSQSVKDFLSQYSGNSTTRLRGIISLELIRRREVAEKFLDVKLDLTILDEAHHCRNTGTLANAIASILTENSDAVLLLTATPLQLGQEDLFNLLNILSPGEFDHFQAFVDRLEPNQYINRAAQILATGDSSRALIELRQVEKTGQKNRFLGSPHYQEVVHILENPHPLPQELVTAQRRLIELNTLASVFTRTRKRDVQEKVPIRTAYVLPVYLSREEKHFYDQVLEEVRNAYWRTHSTGAGSGFVTIMKERQVASCITAFKRRLERGKDEVYLEDTSFVEQIFEEEETFSGEEEQGRQACPDSSYSRKDFVPSTRARIPVLRQDSKFEVFWDALKNVLNDNTSSKVLVFSFFRDTIDYLEHELAMRGVGVRAIHGGYAVNARNEIIEEFRDSPSLRVLVTSDVGSEGLDFQFCDTLFNYDLPWNPMKVEQRIGRIDRFGQEAERIKIYNLVIQDTIESRILYRLYERIEVFQRAIGDIEAILGEQIRGLTEAVFSRRLSPQEEMERAEQVAQTIMRRKQEMEEFEHEKLQFLGQEAIFSTSVEHTIASGRFISDIEILALVEKYVSDLDPLSSIERNEAKEATFALHVNENLIREMKTFVFQNCKNDQTSLNFLKRIRAGQVLPITFTGELAYQRKLLEFITPRHPLARAAIKYWREKTKNSKHLYSIQMKTDAAPAGKYCFFIFYFMAEGIDKDSRIIPIVARSDNGDVHTVLSQQFLRLLQTSAVYDSDPSIECEEIILDLVEESAMLYMTNERDTLYREMQQSNAALIHARLEAVRQSYEAKRNRIQTIRARVSNASILRMYEGQLRNMEAKYLAKVREIERNREVQVQFSLEQRGFLEVL